MAPFKQNEHAQIAVSHTGDCSSSFHFQIFVKIKKITTVSSKNIEHSVIIQ